MGNPISCFVALVLMSPVSSNLLLSTGILTSGKNKSRMRHVWEEWKLLELFNTVIRSRDWLFFITILTVLSRNYFRPYCICYFKPSENGLYPLYFVTGSDKEVTAKLHAFALEFIPLTSQGSAIAYGMTYVVDTFVKNWHW